MAAEGELCGQCRAGGDLHVLPCSHHLCVVCLGKRTDVDNDGIVILQCPRCHVIIDFEDGESPDTLPLLHRTPKVNGHQRDARSSGAQFPVVSTSGHLDRPCSGSCVQGYVAFCLDCNKGLCKTCAQAHHVSAIPNHRTQALLPVVCRTTRENHRKPTLYCLHCKQCICEECADDIHDGHVIKNIDEVAEESRDALIDFVKVTSGSATENVTDQAQSMMTILNRKYASLNHDVATWSQELRHIKSQMAELESKIEMSDMARFAKFLCEKADDPELMFQAQHFSLTHTIADGATIGNAIKSVFPRQPIKETQTKPFLARPQLKIVMPVLHVTPTLSVTSSVTSPNPHIHAPPPTPIRSPSSTPPLTPRSSRRFSARLSNISEDDTSRSVPRLSPRASLRPRALCGGVALDPRAGELVVRTSDPAAPVKVYSHEGELLREGGGKVAGLTGAFSSGIAVDTCRHLYLLATPGGGAGNSGVVVLDRDGRKVKMIGGGRTGAVYDIAYSEHDDLYALSDWDKNQVVIIDPRQGCPVGRFSLAYRCPFKTFWRTYEGHTSLVISDLDGGAVTEYSSNGTFIRTFPTLFDGDSINPSGVCVDHSGYVLICDHDNRRVVGVSEDLTLTCLASASQLGGFPQHITVSTDDDLVAVALRCGQVRIYDQK